MLRFLELLLFAVTLVVCFGYSVDFVVWVTGGGFLAVTSLLMYGLERCILFVALLMLCSVYVMFYL